MSDQIIDDVLPARVKLPYREIREARLVLTPSEALVYASQGSQPVLVAREPWVGRSAPERAGGPATIELASGESWFWWRGRGCSCGSALRRAPLAHDLANPPPS